MSTRLVTRRAGLVVAAGVGLALAASFPAGAAAQAPAFSHESHERLECERCHGTGRATVTSERGWCAECHRAEGGGAGAVTVGERQPSRFRHESHAAIECEACHASGGGLQTGTGRQWCAECHHQRASFTQCTGCHTLSAVRPGPLEVSQTFGFASGLTERRLRFEHTRHAELACGTCHVDAIRFAVKADCESCHSAHHEADSECVACHGKPAEGVHPVEVHWTGCGGAGCHDPERLEVDREALAGSRNVCLACHADQSRHQPGEVCARCHLPGMAVPSAP